MKQTITAPATSAVRVTIYEPRQHPEQEEVIIDVFDLGPGASREVDIASATAGYRTDPVAFERPTDFDEPEPPQEPREKLSPATQAEIEAGRKVIADREKAQQAREKGERATKDAKNADQNTKVEDRAIEAATGPAVATPSTPPTPPAAPVAVTPIPLERQPVIKRGPGRPPGRTTS